MRDIVHHQSPASDPFFVPPARDFECGGGGVTAFQTTVSDDNIEGNAEERFVMTNKIARASRLFRSRRVASLRLGLRKSRKVRLLVAIVSVQLDRCSRGSDSKVDAYPSLTRRNDFFNFLCFLSLDSQRCLHEILLLSSQQANYGGTMADRVQFEAQYQRLFDSSLHLSLSLTTTTSQDASQPPNDVHT